MPSPWDITSNVLQLESAWKARFGGTGVSDARRLRQAKAESGKLKQLLTEPTLGWPTVIQAPFAVVRG